MMRTNSACSWAWGMAERQVGPSSGSGWRQHCNSSETECIRQILDLDVRAGAKGDGPFDHVAQFADVAGPRVGVQETTCGGGNPADRPTVAGSTVLDEFGSQVGDPV